MITRYPIIEFLSKVAGTYHSQENEFELELRQNGYDFVLLTQSGSVHSQIYGVIGVSGENLELHASVGLPNILVFTWPHALDETEEFQSIVFQEQDSGFKMIFEFRAQSNALKFSLEIDNKEKASYELHKL